MRYLLAWLVLLTCLAAAAPLRSETQTFYADWEKHWNARRPWECKKMLDAHPELAEQAFYDVVQYLQSHPDESSKYRLFLAYISGMLRDTRPELRATLEDEGLWLNFRRMRPEKGANVSGLTLEFVRKYGEAAQHGHGREFIGQNWQFGEYAFYDLLAHPQPDSGKFLQDAAAQLRAQGRPFDSRPTRIWQLSQLAQGALDEGRKAEAIQRLQETIALVEEMIARAGPKTREALRLQRLNFVPYELLARLQIESNQPAEAFETVARQQQAEALAQSRLLEDDPQVAGLMRLRGGGDTLEQDLVTAQLGNQDTAVVQKQLAQNRSEFYTTLGDIKKTNPDYEKMLAVRPVNFSKIQPSIPEDTLVLQLYPSDDLLYLFVATRQELKIKSVQVSRRELESLVGQARQGLVNPQKPVPEQALKRLYQLLVAPVEAELSGKSVVAFIPTGALAYLPFPALKGKDYLVKSKQCVTLLKSSDLEQLFRPAEKTEGVVLGLGDPDGSLPEAGREVTAIGELFPGSHAYTGAQATSGHLQEMTGVAYLHLATHGVLDAQDPNASYLVVAGQPSKLTVTQIPALAMDKVRLVTLSACQTALGDRAPGSELTTLADAFSFAGTRAVVASLWSVSDASTRELMLAFYGGLKAGQNPALSLQQAQLKVLGNPRMAHPFYWAPFEVIGDWR